MWLSMLMLLAVAVSSVAEESFKCNDDVLIAGGTSTFGIPIAKITGNDDILIDDVVNQWSLEIYFNDGPVSKKQDDDKISFEWTQKFDNDSTDISLWLHPWEFSLLGAYTHTSFKYRVCLLFNPDICSEAYVYIIDPWEPKTGGAVDAFYPLVGDRPTRRFPTDDNFVQLTPSTVLKGDAFIYLISDWFPDGCVRWVHFCFDVRDDCHTEWSSPYDVAGGGTSQANPTDTTALSNGLHFLTVTIAFKSPCYTNFLTRTFPFKVKN